MSAYGRRWRQVSAEAIRRQPWCSECGSRDDLTGDHLIPVSVGGRDTLANARVLCRSCNARRGARPVEHVQLALQMSE